MPSDDDRTHAASPREIPSQAPLLSPSLTERLRNGRWWRNLIGEAGAEVFRVQLPTGPDVFLKQADGDDAQALIDEMVRLAWLSRLDAGNLPPVPAIVHAETTGGRTWLLTSAMPGRTAYAWLQDDPGRGVAIVQSLAAALRRWHALPVHCCPFNADHMLRLAHARRRLDAGLIDADDFDDARAGWTPAQVWAAMQALLPLRAERVVTHGDYSLDNILLDAQGQVTGIIDVGKAGIADPYQDLAILWNCLSEFGAELQQALLTAYATELDLHRLTFHLYLDECF